jgi:hypothetical protein
MLPFPNKKHGTLCPSNLTPCGLDFSSNYDNSTAQLPFSWDNQTWRWPPLLPVSHWAVTQGPLASASASLTASDSYESMHQSDPQIWFLLLPSLINVLESSADFLCNLYIESWTLQTGGVGCPYLPSFPNHHVFNKYLESPALHLTPNRVKGILWHMVGTTLAY